MASGNGRRADVWTWDEALRGVVPPLISPLDSTGQPDAAALDALVAHVVEVGCSVTALCQIYGGDAHWLPSLKAACAVLGLGNGAPAPPLVSLAEDGRARVSAPVRRHAGLLAR